MIKEWDGRARSCHFHLGRAILRNMLIPNRPVVVAAILAAAALPAAASQRKIDLSTYPAAVRTTIEAETKNATLKNVSKETEKGQTQYEVETVVNGKTRDLLIDPSGKVLEVEEEIALAAAPPPVQSALAQQGTVTRLESVRRNGVTTFEATVQHANGRKASVALDAQGKRIKG
jgi:uncharacterized membrane protein YkoI